MAERRARREHRAVIWLDRDGTLVDDPGYLGDWTRLVLLPAAGEAVARLGRAGATIVLVTNQSGIGRGLIGAGDVDRVHEELRRQLGASGAALDDIRICPHAPPAAGESGCACRKPRPGLVLEARRALGIADTVPQAVVGDKVADIELARAVGARAVLVLTGEGEATRAELAVRGGAPDHVATDLAAAVPWLVRELGLAEPGPNC